MKLKDASKAINAKQQQHKGSNIKAQEVAASSNDVANKQDTNIKAKTGRLQQEQPQRGSQQLGQEQQLGTIGMQPDPLLLVALHVSVGAGPVLCFGLCCAACLRVTERGHGGACLLSLT